MKKLTKSIFILILCVSLCGCAPLQATLADTFESAYGDEGKSYEEHLAYYQEEWDMLFGDLGKLLGIAADEAEELVKDTAEEAVEEIFNGEEKRVTEEIYSLRDTYGTRYNGSGQCKGFARKVFCDLFGKDSVVPSTADNNYELIESSNDSVDKVAALLNIQSKTNEEIMDAFSEVRPGDIVQMRRTHGGPHTAVVISVTDNGMMWIEANLDGNNGIVVEEYTWKEIRDGKNGYRMNEHLTIYTATEYKLDD